MGAVGDHTAVDEAATAAVVAHGLLNSIFAAKGLVQTIVRRYDDLGDDIKREMLDRVLERIEFNHTTLKQLVLALPVSNADVAAALRAHLAD